MSSLFSGSDGLEWVVLVVAVAVVCGAIGESISESRGRPTLGFVLGLLLGPLGLILVLLLIRDDEQEAPPTPPTRLTPWGIAPLDLERLRVTYGDTYSAVLDEVRGRPGAADASVDVAMLEWLCVEVVEGRGGQVDLESMLEERRERTPR